MKKRDPDLLLFHAPLLRQGMTTPSAMRDVVWALMPKNHNDAAVAGISAQTTSRIALGVVIPWRSSGA